MEEKERDYIGLVVDIDPSVNQVDVSLKNAVEIEHANHPEKKQMSYGGL